MTLQNIEVFETKLSLCGQLGAVWAFSDDGTSHIVLAMVER